MTIEQLTAEDVDYLQRTGFQPPPCDARAGMTEALPVLRTLQRVAGVGRLDKAARRTGGWPGSAATDLLVGLYNYKVPLAFLVGGRPGRTSIGVGTWLPAEGARASIEQNRLLLDTALQALYPAIQLAPERPVTGNWELGGLVLGMPTPKLPDALDGSLPIDRLLRGMRGVAWAALVLAQPVEEIAVRELRLQVINEMRSVQTAAKHEGVPSPLADQYVGLLERQLHNLSDGQGRGAWRTGVYLLGDVDGYYRLTSLWRGVFAGEESLPEPVRVWDLAEAPLLAHRWALPDPVEERWAPGRYRHPFQHQTLLTSAQLGAYVQMPNLETGGFAITQVPDFDVVAPEPAPRSLMVGRVVEHQVETPTPYGVGVDSLTRHTFVTGVTGSGKTNTLLHLLRQLAAAGTPFLVIEPTKTEYRVLLRDRKLGDELQVFTLGEETVSPFRLNPFEVPDGIPVAVHLDLLRSVFDVSFGMWTPLPQVLETSLHAIYADRGWDVTANTNHRLGDDTDAHRADAFPTLTDLVRKVEEIVPRLGYEERVTGDIQAALRTRLNSLRTGGKGRMLDVRRSLPMQTLLDRPAVLELNAIGDDDDKAFLMGLVLIRLAEHGRTRGDVDELRHLLVIEEAHRLLANPEAHRQEGEADVRGKAVETFTNLLSEIRAYGQGVVVADQIPTKLAPDVVKNSNFKVAHRIVAGDDRAVLGAAMAMTPAQELSLATLSIGRAAVFTDGEDAPLLVQVPRSKGGSGSWPDDREVREQMGPRMPTETGGVAAGSLPTSECDDRCRSAQRSCELARRLTDDATVMRTLGRVVLSAVQTPGGLERSWPEVVAVVRPRLPATLDLWVLLGCLSRHGARALADRRGALAGWTYADTATVAELVDAMLLAHLQEQEAEDAAIRLRIALLALQNGTYGPFEGCQRIWAERLGPCLCRYPVAELVGSGAFAGGWADARRADRAAAEGGREAVWDLSQDAAYQLVEFPTDGQDPQLAARLSDVARCTALCFAQQMLDAEEWAHPATNRRALEELLAESGHGGVEEGVVQEAGVE